MRVAVLGVGLIGGSVGLAAAARLGADVVGWDPDAGALARAAEKGAVGHRSPSLEEAVRGANAVVVAAPVGVLADVVAAALAASDNQAVVTDVGSTKRGVVAAHPHPRFVGGHPLAGAETAGVEHAREDLFDGATWYLTPTATTSGVHFERLHRFVSGLGARPQALDANRHDALLAAVSHLPHVLANVLVAQAAQVTAEDPVPAAGPSFRDATRVAGASSAIWRDIYLSNADVLVERIDDTVARLTTVRDALAARDGERITAWNDGAREDRRTLLEAGLTGGPVHELRIRVSDQPGVIASLALELGRAGVNITDMALYPAPDGRSGSVALWIAGDAPAARAQELVGGLGFTVARP